MNIPSKTLPGFETERFVLVPLSPSEARKLVEVLLQDPILAEHVPWMTEKTRDGALREAFGVELRTAAGQLKVWGIIAKGAGIQLGAIIASNSIEGINVEILVASRFWEAKVADEASKPVVDWLDDNAEVIQDHPIILH